MTDEQIDRRTDGEVLVIGYRYTRSHPLEPSGTQNNTLKCIAKNTQYQFYLLKSRMRSCSERSLFTVDVFTLTGSDLRYVVWIIALVLQR